MVSQWADEGRQAGRQNGRQKEKGGGGGSERSTPCASFRAPADLGITCEVWRPNAIGSSVSRVDRPRQEALSHARRGSR